MAAILKTGGHMKIVCGPHYFPDSIEYVQQILCFYHNLKDSYTYVFR